LRGAGAHGGAGQEREREHLGFRRQAVRVEEFHAAQHVVRRVAGETDDQVDQQLDAFAVQHARRLGDLLRRSAPEHALEGLPVDGLKPDLQPVEPGLLQLAGLLGREALRAHLGEEGEGARRVLADQRVEQRLEFRTMVERRVQEDHLPRAAVTQSRDERRAALDVECAEHAGGPRVEAEGAVRAAAADRLDVGRALALTGTSPSR